MIVAGLAARCVMYIVIDCSDMAGRSIELRPHVPPRPVVRSELEPNRDSPDGEYVERSEAGVEGRSKGVVGRSCGERGRSGLGGLDVEPSEDAA